MCQPRGEVAAREVTFGQGLVVRQPGLLERMREGVVPDVVQQRRQPHGEGVARVEPGAGRLLELGERAPGQVVGAQRVLEAAVGRAGVDEKRLPQLAYVAQALHRGGVHHGERLGVQPDVVPERVAHDLELGRSHARGPASRTA